MALAQSVAKGPLPELWCKVERRHLRSVCYLADELQLNECGGEIKVAGWAEVKSR